TFPDTERKGRRIMSAEITDNGETKRIEGNGTGPIDGFVDALSHYLGIKLSVVDYSEHSLRQGSDASAVCYMEIAYPAGRIFGVGINDNIVTASLEAIIAAANRVVAAGLIGLYQARGLGDAAEQGDGEDQPPGGDGEQGQPRGQGRLVRFMAKQEVFEHPVAGPLMRAMKHIPVDRYGKARDAVEESIDRLRRGQIVGMFPEGTISPSFVPREGKTGAARMAIEAGAPLIPAATWGTQRILTKWRPKNFQRGVAIDVHYGEPIDTSHGDPERATKELMEAIGGLVDRAAERYPQEPADDDDRWWLPLHLGGTAPTPEDAERRLAEQRARVRREREQQDQQD
ncbi:MAG: 1-acyl-sn-glycerol-3-phosphate acyltransferase, partial [Actinobacteria bacterium]|nr:1-acyl-sn-glycerol-3-phosphate acyltransferase [Actinomycetota bacterium]